MREKKKNPPFEHRTSQPTEISALADRSLILSASTRHTMLQALSEDAISPPVACQYRKCSHQEHLPAMHPQINSIQGPHAAVSGLQLLLPSNLNKNPTPALTLQ